MKPTQIVLDEAVYAAIPDVGITPTSVKVHRKDIKVTWDLGREDTDFAGRPMWLEAELWIHDGYGHLEFSAMLSQHHRTTYGHRSGSVYPYVSLLRESRERFSPKRFREFWERAFAELERRRHDPDVQAVFDPAAAPSEGSAT